MGRRGPPPTPTGILKLRGSWRGNRNPAEPNAPTGKPRCPRWLDAAAKAAWRQLVPRLDAMGILTLLDRNALARYCQLWSRWKRAEEFLQQHGDSYVVKDALGKAKGVKAYPQVRMAAQLSEALLRLEQNFGLTPSARARLQAPPQEADHGDDKSRYLRVG